METTVRILHHGTEPPKPGELLALDAKRARKLFANWLRDESFSNDIALLSFSQQVEEASKAGWAQARWHEDGDATVSDYLSYNSVWEINPFEIGARRPVARKAFASVRERVFRLLDLRRLAKQPVMSLSNGETRRVLLARALLKQPRVLALDDPAAGLDVRQREKLKDIIMSLCRRGAAVAMGYRHEDEVTGWYSKRRKGCAPKTVCAHSAASDVRSPVVEISNLSLSMGGRTLFDNFSWTVREGERWILRGENGKGKSTLLSLINGDNPFAYACDIKVFGISRGEGATLDSFRSRIGTASAEMQACSGMEPMALLEDALSPGHELLLLDEPFMNMDARARAQARRKISEFLVKNPGAAAIIVSHREDDIPRGFVLELNI